MKSFLKFLGSPVSLRRQYYFIFVTVLGIILFFLAGYITYSYQIFQKQVQQKLEFSASSIMEELERGFDDNQTLLKYLGETIVKTSAHEDLESLAKTLTSVGKINVRSLATSFISWANPEGYIHVNSKEGILKQKRTNILTRHYFKTARENPWTTQFSEDCQSLFGVDTVLPTAMGIQSSSGEFLGYLVLGLKLKQLTEQLAKFSDDSDIYFLILDQHYNLAISSHESLKKEFLRESFHLTQQILKKDSKNITFQEMDIEFKVLKSFSRYPFIILTGYKKDKVVKDLIWKLGPSVLEFLVMAYLAVTLLYLFRQKIISPINKIYESCLKVSQGEKNISFPHFNIQELDKMSEGIKIFISRAYSL